MANRDDFEEQSRFEEEVRRTAEALWGLNSGDCQPEHYSDNADVRELDGLVKLRDMKHLLMATVSTRLDKAKEDVKKLAAAARIESRDGSLVQKWYITKLQLNAEHVKYCRENSVNALSLEQFKSRFFDGRNYIQKRRTVVFGSARNLLDDSVTIPEDEYVYLPMSIVGDEKGKLETPSTINFKSMVEKFAAGECLVILAPFGGGKSLTVREIFLDLTKTFLKSGIGRIPISINLREHWGARYGDEIFERHAREIGFQNREDLIAAWRAGLSLLLLDGFDEVATQIVARVGNRNIMRQARQDALRAVQDILQKIPSGSGVLIAGRDHYFDNHREMIQSLGLQGRSFSVIELGEFGEEEAARYLKKKGLVTSLPSWLPRKPLILAYLASRNLLEQVLQIDGNRGFGFAWDSFLTRICDREAAYGGAAMDERTLRNLLERLAFECRSKSQGNGPIAERDLAEAYFDETGETPGESVLMQLQRLPGLTARGLDAGHRSFVDSDMLAALQGGALARFILEGRTFWSKRSILSSLQPRAAAMAAFLLDKAGAKPNVVIAVAARISTGGIQSGIDAQIVADCCEVAIEMSQEESTIDFGGLRVERVCLGDLNLEDIRIENILFEDCQINEVSINEMGLTSKLKFLRCDIQRVSGLASKAALPNQMFSDCTIESFDSLSTNSSIVRSALPVRLKALLTVLRKLYSQAGAGRKLNAFKRGIPSGPIMDAIDEVVGELQTEGLLFVEKGVAHPIRKYMTRAHRILSLGMASEDPIVKRMAI